MVTIGITGPTGAGKTTALRVLEALGGTVIDCDAVYHRLLERDRELLGQIEAAFPGVVRDGVLDRKALGARVYADPAALERLNGIAWPAVRREVERIIRGCASTGRSPSAGLAPGSPPLQAGEVLGASFAVIDAIGLFESGLAELCDRTVAVIAKEEIRVRRLMARDGIDEDYARARIAAQKPAAWFAERADLVLENNGTEAEFDLACREAFGEDTGDGSLCSIGVSKAESDRETQRTVPCVNDPGVNGGQGSGHPTKEGAVPGAAAPDLCVPCGDGLVNIRVGAILRRDGKLLMVRNRRDPYLYSVGGRVQLGETAAEAVVREVFEETGVRLAVDRLGYVHENLFLGDVPANRGRLIYELCFYFWMVVPEGFAPVGDSATADGLDERLEWVLPDTDQQIYPEFFRSLPDKPSSGVQFVQTDERN